MNLVLDRYRIERRIGAGGFGNVYYAIDELLEREVAIKVIPCEGETPDRVRREALAGARLDHPAIVRVFDLQQEGDSFFLVSELVHGQSLAELEKDDVLSDADVVLIGIAIAEALSHAHERGVIHRDLKPHNVIVPYGDTANPNRQLGQTLVDELQDSPGMLGLSVRQSLNENRSSSAGVLESDDLYSPNQQKTALAREGNLALETSTPAAFAKLTDFGIAQLVDAEALTLTGEVMGTLAYMAPEQADGERGDERTDLYGLALMLYEALSGENPRRGRNPAETAALVDTVLPKLAYSRRDLPPGLCEAIDRAVDPDPDYRGELVDLAGALEDALPEVQADANEYPHTWRDRLFGRSNRADWSSGLANSASRSAHMGVETQFAYPEAIVPPDPSDAYVNFPFLPNISPRVVAGLGAFLLISCLLLGPIAPLIENLAWAEPVTIFAVVAAVTGLVIAFPRGGWLTVATVAIISLGAVKLSGNDSLSGNALLTAAALAASPLILRYRPTAWSYPIVAPILGIVGVASCFPALAGCARSLWTRVGLASIGAWWLLLAEPILQQSLLWSSEKQSFPAGLSTSTELAANSVGDVFTSQSVLIVPLWALTAAVFPYLVGGRSLFADLGGALVWVGTLIAGMVAIAESFVGDHAIEGSMMTTLVMGSLLGCALGTFTMRRRES